MEIKILDDRIDLKRATFGSAGFDLQAATFSPIILKPNESLLIPTGLAIWIKDPNLAGFIYPRSKLGSKLGLVLGNLTGVIDSDYTGQWHISMWNRSSFDRVIEPLEYIAQVVFKPVHLPQFDVVKEFSSTTARGDGGINKLEDTNR